MHAAISLFDIAFQEKMKLRHCLKVLVSASAWSTLLPHESCLIDSYTFCELTFGLVALDRMLWWAWPGAS